MRWFRVYDDAINDPKILKLPEATRWHWIAVLCIASKNDGVLPSTSDIAISLRVTPAKASTIVAALKQAGLLDYDDGKFTPHNWSGRQYKSDTSNERVKRYRERKCNVTQTVTETAPETEQKQTTEQIDRIGEARSNFTQGSKALASAFWKALGFETPLHVSPQFAGVDWRAVSWEQAGWTVDLINSETRRIGPDKPLVYYEKVFATAFAKRQAPLPVVEIREAEQLTVTNHARPKNGIIQAADDLVRKLASFDGPARGPDEVCGDAGQAPPRLLSHG